MYLFAALLQIQKGVGRCWQAAVGLGAAVGLPRLTSAAVGFRAAVGLGCCWRAVVGLRAAVGLPQLATNSKKTKQIPEYILANTTRYESVNLLKTGMYILYMRVTRSSREFQRSHYHLSDFAKSWHVHFCTCELRANRQYDKGLRANYRN